MIATILGAGAWGTTFAQVLADAGCQVRLWARNSDVVAQINTEHVNQKRLPNVVLPQSIVATTDLAQAICNTQLLVVAIPSQSARTLLTEIRPLLPAGVIAVSLMKGVELETYKRMSEVIAEALEVPIGQVVVISGPNLAAEIALRQPTATVVCSSDQNSAEVVAKACSNSYFRPYTNFDVVGVELCGAVKNVIALAVGIAQGRGYGYNTTATVITRGLAEITRLGLRLGADVATFSGLAGLGDLVATCTSPLSRNHTLGRHVGQGKNLADALAETGGTAEGVKSCQSVLTLAESVGVEMPITQAVNAVLYEDLGIEEMVRKLLSRPQKAEGPGGELAARGN